ncbi:MAG TPA: hypothetical protein VF698_00190 [Thermoanaerobaculia bacterium]|jgi:hypothetical protein
MTAGATGAVIAAMMQAIKASGVLVRIEPEEFMKIVRRAEAPLVIRADGGLFSKKNQYLTSYKGFAFFTKSNSELPLPPTAEVMKARSIFIPA